MSRIVHFEIQADDPQRAIEFYRKSLGWDFQKWGEHDYWLVKTGPANEPGIDGGILPRRGPINYVNTAQVESVDDTIKAVEAAGGQLVVPKSSIPGVGWLAYCKDTEGNVFGIMTPDPGAK
jgi:predicted enzyme related to lactoylglutathione lyase